MKAKVSIIGQMEIDPKVNLKMVIVSFASFIIMMADGTKVMSLREIVEKVKEQCFIQMVILGKTIRFENDKSGNLLLLFEW